MSGECGRSMRGLYGAETICARPLGHQGACHPVRDEREWAGLEATDERCPSCRHEWNVIACEQCGDRWERPGDEPGSVVLTPEQVAQVRKNANSFLKCFTEPAFCRMPLHESAVSLAYSVLAMLEPKP